MQPETSESKPLSVPPHKRYSRAHTLYCNWGHYDELGDTVPLTAALCHEELNCLERWQHEAGLYFDYFVVDCLWFDPELGFKYFRKDRFPDGFEPIRDRICKLGMTPGLWYSVNGLRLEVPEWAESRDANGGYSLAEGPYADAFARAPEI